MQPETTQAHVERSIELLRDEIAKHEQEIASKKTALNRLCEAIGRPAIYPDLQAPEMALHEDEFYGIGLSEAVQRVMQRRRATGQGSATCSEILETLQAGGYVFATKNAENAKRALYGVLKDPVFHKLPKGSYGLLAWYPNAKKGRVEESEVEASVTTSGDGEGQKDAA